MSMLETRTRLPVGSAWGDVDSPIGPLGVVVTPDGLLCVGFSSLASLAPMFVTSDADSDRDRDGGVGAEPVVPLGEHEVGARVVAELEEYFAGRRTRFTVPVNWSLTSGVQRSILTTLYTKVPYGSTVGYGELALLAGRTLGASRLVGTVMGSNPIPIVVPCHRVIAADGGIGGFGGGLEAKRWLLALEGVLPPSLF